LLQFGGEVVGEVVGGVVAVPAGRGLRRRGGQRQGEGSDRTGEQGQREEVAGEGMVFIAMANSFVSVLVPGFSGVEVTVPGAAAAVCRPTGGRSGCITDPPIGGTSALAVPS
jgi:hypothetical protein